MDNNHSSPSSPRENSRPQHRPPSPPSPPAFENRAYLHDEADQNHNDSFTSTHQNGHSKEPNGQPNGAKTLEAVNLEMINLTPKNGNAKKKDVEVEINATNPYEEYFVPVNEHRKYMRGEKLYVTADKRGEKSKCKRPLCWTLLALVVAAVIALIVLAATGVLFATSPTEVDQYNSSVSSARAFGGFGSVPTHDHNHDPEHDYDHSHGNHDHSDHDHDHSNHNHDHSYHDQTHSDHFTTQETQNDQSDNYENDSATVYVPKTLEGQIKIDNVEFTEQLKDRNSEEYRQITTEVANSLKSLLENAAYDRNSMDGVGDMKVEVIELRRGSVVVIFRVHWTMKNDSMTSQDPMTVSTLKSDIENYLERHNRMISFYNIAEDYITTNQVIDLCQTDLNGCEYGCTFDKATLDFMCTCPDGQIRDSNNPKRCVYESDLRKEYRGLENMESHNGFGFMHSSPEPTAEPKVETEPTAEPKTEPEPTAEPKAEPEPTTEPKAEPEPTAEPKAETEPTAEPKVEPEPTAEPKVEPEPTAEPKAEPEPTAEPKVEPEPTTELKAEPEPTAEPKAEPEPTAEPKAEPEPTAEPKAEPEPAVEHKAEPEPITEPKSVPEPTAEYQAVPEQTAEPKAEPEPTAEPKAELEPIVEPKAESEPTAEPNAEPEPTSETKVEPEPTTEAKAEPETTGEPKVQPEPTVEPQAIQIVTAESKAESEPSAEPKVEPEPTAEPKVEPEPTAEPKVEPESTAETKIETESNQELKTESQATAEPNIEPQPTAELKAELEPNIEPNTEPKAEPETTIEPKSASETSAESKAELALTVIPKTESEPKTEEQSPAESKTEPSPKSKVETDLTSEPKIEPELTAAEVVTKTSVNYMESNEREKTNAVLELTTEYESKGESNMIPKRTTEYQGQSDSSVELKTDTVLSIENAITSKPVIKETTTKDITTEAIPITNPTTESKHEIKSESTPFLTQPTGEITTLRSNIESEQTTESKPSENSIKMNTEYSISYKVSSSNGQNLSESKDTTTESEWIQDMTGNENLTHMEQTTHNRKVEKETETSSAVFEMSTNSQSKELREKQEDNNNIEEKRFFQPAPEITTTAQFGQVTEKFINSGEIHKIDTNEHNSMPTSTDNHNIENEISINRSSKSIEENGTDKIFVNKVEPRASTESDWLSVSEIKDNNEGITTVAKAPEVPIEVNHIEEHSSSQVKEEKEPKNELAKESISNVMNTVASATDLPAEPTTVSEYIYKIATTTEVITKQQSDNRTIFVNPAPVWEEESVEPQPIQTSTESTTEIMNVTLLLPEITNASTIPQDSTKRIESEYRNLTQTNHLNVTIYERAPSNNESQKTVVSHSAEYVDHDKDPNPFLPEAENNNLLVKKLQEGHDLEPSNMNETQNDSIDEHSMTSSDVSASHTERKITEEVPTTNMNNSLQKVLTQTSKSQSEAEVPLSTFLADTDDLDVTKVYKSSLVENTTSGSEESNITTDKNLSVVPIAEEKLEEKQTLKKNFKSDNSIQDLNDISDSHKKSDRRTYDAIDSVIYNEA